MKTLMRNGRDRRSENPFLGHAKKERVGLFGTDQRITSGPAARRPHSKAEYMTAPERFADSQIPLAPRAPSIHDPPCLRRDMPREVSRHDKTGENSRPTNKENSTPAHKPRRIAVRRKIISFDVHDASGTDGWPAPPARGRLAEGLERIASADGPRYLPR